MINIHYLQHVPFEGPAKIGEWALSNKHNLTSTKLYEDAILPPVKNIDWLVVMGGPMNIYEEEVYPWLAQEKKFISEVIEAGKTVLGVCLGAQLIADVLGAKVYRGQHKEIGWLPIELTHEAKASELFGSLPESFTVFHWHGDTFDLPAGAVQLAKSKGCEQQAFLYDGRVLGLQFHLESTVESIQKLVQHCKSDISEGQYVQKAETMLLEGQSHVQGLHKVLEVVLEQMTNLTTGTSKHLS